MKKWQMEQHLYKVYEGNKKRREEYPILATGEEMARFLKGHNEMNGYVDGVGGDKSYYCYAVQMR